MYKPVFKPMFKGQLNSVPWLTIGLGAIAIAIALLPETVQSALIFNKATVMSSTPWQFFSAHLVHGDLQHLFWDVLGLLVVGSMLERMSRTAWLSAVAIGLFVVNSFLVSSFSSIQYYCGLSGLLNTLVFVLFWELWDREKSKTAILLAGLCLVKIAVEMQFNEAMLTSISWPPYPASHLAGFVGALFYVTLHLIKSGRVTYSPFEPLPFSSSRLAALNPTGCQSWRNEMSRLEP